jgi:hypothetical protein
MKKKKADRSDETMSILKFLRQNAPAEQNEELELPALEETPEDHPILKKKRKTKIF